MTVWIQKGVIDFFITKSAILHTRALRTSSSPTVPTGPPSEGEKSTIRNVNGCSPDISQGTRELEVRGSGRALQLELKLGYLVTVWMMPLEGEDVEVEHRSIRWVNHQSCVAIQGRCPGLAHCVRHRDASAHVTTVAFAPFLSFT